MKEYPMGERIHSKYNRNVKGGVCWLCHNLLKIGDVLICIAEGEAHVLTFDFVDQSDAHMEFCDKRIPVL